ncbi:MAG TPA: YciI family protein [Bryobacteraceae bacterium]|nr:YciI family protein [Bryobacteraceae bacterium]
MDYMFLIYSDPAAQWTPERMRAATTAHWGVMDDAAGRGVLKSCSPLAPPATAVTVRCANGSTTMTDGPFAETREFLAGYYVIACDDAADAKYWAERISAAGCGSTVEVRASAPVSARLAAHA